MSWGHLPKATEVLGWGHLPAGQRGLPWGEPCRRRALGGTREAFGLRRMLEAAAAVGSAEVRP